MQPDFLQRNISMLLRRTLHLFATESSKRLQQTYSCLLRFNYFIYISSGCCYIRIQETFLIFLFALLTHCSRIFSSLNLSLKCNINCTFCTHNSYFCDWPCEYHISTHLLRVHGDISTAVCLTHNYGNLRYSSF